MSKITKAVIVAAGLSSRLYPLTLDIPKGLLRVSGETILGRSVRLLRESGINEILVVVGYLSDLIKRKLGDGVHYQLNPFFAETNNMGSLWFAQSWVGDEPFLYLHGDIIYDHELLRAMMSGSYSDAALLVDYGDTDEEAMKVRVKDGLFVESNKLIPLNEAVGEWVGIASFMHPSVLFYKIESLLEERHFQVYDTLAFSEMANDGIGFSIVRTNGLPWVEIDFESDLNHARKLFP